MNTPDFVMDISKILFAIAIYGFLTKRNLIVMFLSLELILISALLNLVVHANIQANLYGQAFGLFLITIAAGEAAIALAIFVVTYRSTKQQDTVELSAIEADQARMASYEAKLGSQSQ